jgi:hypothetical protein
LAEIVETFPRSFRGSLRAHSENVISSGSAAGSGNIVLDIFLILFLFVFGWVIQLARWPFIRNKPFATIMDDALVVKGRVYPFDNIASVSLSEPKPFVLYIHFHDFVRATPPWLFKLGIRNRQVNVSLFALAGDREKFGEAVKTRWQNWKALGSSANGTGDAAIRKEG